MIPSIALVATAYGASVTLTPGDDVDTLTQSLQAGDVVTFTDGVYEIDGQLNWTGLGSAEQPIRFVAATDADVVLRNIGGGWVANVTDAEYIEIVGLAFEGGGDIMANEPAGVRIANSSHVTLENCTVRNVWGTVLRLDGNTNNLVVRRNELGPSEDGNGIDAGTTNGSGWMQDSLIANNLIHDIANTALEMRPFNAGNTIEDNAIFRASTGVVMPDTQFGDQNVLVGNAIWQIEGDGVVVRGSSRVQSNVVFEIGDEGIQTVESPSLYDVQITHNTVVRTDGWAAQLGGWYDAPDMSFANNALSNPTGRSLEYIDPMSNQAPEDPPVPDTANFIANNVVTGLINGFDPLVRPDWIREGGGIGDFADIDDFDFYPSSSSQLLGAGSSDGAAFIPELDFNGRRRNGASPDVGAYEYDGGANPGWLIQEGFKDLGDQGPGQTNGGGCCNGNDDPTQALLVTPLLALGAFVRRRRRERR